MKDMPIAVTMMDLIRIYVGIALFAKGIQFVLYPKTLTIWLDSASDLLVFPTIASHYVLFAHLCFGITLAVGLLTRISALAQIPVLLGAVFAVHMKEGLFAVTQNLELTILVLFLLVAIIITGSGPFSADRYLLTHTDD